MQPGEQTQGDTRKLLLLFITSSLPLETARRTTTKVETAMETDSGPGKMEADEEEGEQARHGTATRRTCWTRVCLLLFLFALFPHIASTTPSPSDPPSTSPSSTIFAFDSDFSTLATASLNSAILNSNDILVVDYAHNFSLSQPNAMSSLQEGDNSSLIAGQDSEETDTPDPNYVYFLDVVRFWVQRVLVPVIMLVGVVGNSITIAIMTRRRMRSSTNWYLAALAIFDMIYLVFTFVLSLKHYPNAHDVRYYYYWYMIPFSMMITDASSNTSVWLTVTFTIERYIAVCHPIKGKVICTESRAKRVIFCVFIVCVSITVPTPFEWIVFEGADPITNQTRMQVTFSELGKNNTYKSIYYHLNVFLFVLLPLVLLVIFNTFLIRSVHQSTKQRSKMVMGKDSPYQPNSKSGDSSSPSSSRQEIRITVMLIAVVILFIICQTPTAVILVYTVFHEAEPNSNEQYLLTGLSNIFNFLMSINAAGNFVLYCLLSQKYRRTFVNMFCPCISPKYLVTQTTYLRTNEHSVTVNHQTQTNHAHHHAHHRFNNETEKRNSNGLLASSGQLNCTATGGGTGPTYRSTSSSSISTNHDSGHHRIHFALSRNSPSSSIKCRSSADRDCLPKNGTDVSSSIDQSHLLLLEPVNGSHNALTGAAPSAVSGSPSPDN